MKKQYKSLIIAGISIVIFVVILSVVYSRLPDKNSYMDRVNNQEGSSYASFAVHADSIDELIDMSDLIIEGKVVDYEPMLFDKYILTNETVEVKKALKGNVTKGDRINVVFTGGELNGKITPPIKDCPLMDMRGNYMLFLITNDGKNYFIIGGNQGFGSIKDNKINIIEKDSLGDTLKNLNISDLENIVIKND